MTYSTLNSISKKSKRPFRN